MVWGMVKIVKRAYRYRFYPSPEQAAELNRTFGCVRKVWNARITDRRRDFLHKLTTRLARENQAVVIEDLNVANMTRNHRLARASSDAA